MLDRPSDYCDRRCEVCPQRSSCKLHAIGERRRREHPDRTWLEWVEADLTEALEIAERALREEGIDPATVGPPPTNPEAERLRSLAVAYAATVLRVVDAAPLTADRELLDDLSHFAVVVAQKVASAAEGLDDPRDEMLCVWAHSLLVLEVAARRVEEALESLLEPWARERLIPFHERLNAGLSPLYRRLPSSVRDELREKVAAGLAPSPFMLVPRT